VPSHVFRPNCSSSFRAPSKHSNSASHCFALSVSSISAQES
jgi:hypothetical protein